MPLSALLPLRATGPGLFRITERINVADGATAISDTFVGARRSPGEAFR